MHQDDVVGFLKAFAKEAHGHGVFVRGNEKIHKDVDVDDFFGGKRLECVFIAGYCPELDQEEGVWPFQEGTCPISMRMAAMSLPGGSGESC